MSIAKPVTPGYGKLDKVALPGTPSLRPWGLGNFNGVQPFVYFGHASKQRRASTPPFGRKPDDKAHQQNAGSR